jgi:hypothetical protein
MAVKKPRPIEFMLRGYELADTLAILDRWEALSEDEKRALGFTDAGTVDLEAPESSAAPSSTLH